MRPVRIELTTLGLWDPRATNCAIAAWRICQPWDFGELFLSSCIPRQWRIGVCFTPWRAPKWKTNRVSNLQETQLWHPCLASCFNVNAWLCCPQACLSLRVQTVRGQLSRTVLECQSDVNIFLNAGPTVDCEPWFWQPRVIENLHWQYILYFLSSTWPTQHAFFHIHIHMFRLPLPVLKVSIKPLIHHAGQFNGRFVVHRTSSGAD